jgi:WD40 repeat protein
LLLGCASLLAAPNDKPPMDKRSTDQILEAQAALHHLQRLATERDVDVPELWRVWQAMRLHHFGSPEFGRAGEVMAVAPSPFDRLDPDRIPPEERRAGLPKEVVAVLGSPRGKHWKEVYRVVRSLNGKRLASVGDDLPVRVWDTATMREEAAVVPDADEGSLIHLALSPNGDLLALNSPRSGETLLVRLDGERPRKQRLACEWNIRIRPLTFSPDGKTLAIVGGGYQVWLWDVEGREARLHATLEHNDFVSSVVFSPDSRRLAAVVDDTRVHLWDLDGATPRKRGFCRQRTKCQELSTLPIAFSPNGKTLAAGSEDGVVRLWDVSTATPRERCSFTAHKETVNLLAFSGSGQFLASAENGKSPELRVWDVARDQPQEVAAYTGDSAPHWPTDLVFAADGKTLAQAIGHYGNAVCIWDLDGRRATLRGIPELATAVTSAVTVSADNQTIAAASTTGVVQSWDVNAAAPRLRGRLLSEYGGGPQIAFASAAAALDLATLRKDVLSVWDLTAQPPKLRSRGEEKSERCQALALSPDGKTLAVAAGNDVGLWDVSRAIAVRLHQIEGERHERTSIAFAPDGKLLAVGSDDNRELKLWDRSGEEPQLRDTLKGPSPDGSVLAFAPNGRWLAAAGDQDRSKGEWGIITLVEFKDGKAATPVRLDADPHVQALAFAPDGRTLGVATATGHLTLWDVTTRKELRGWELPGPIMSVVYSWDGRHLITGNANGTAYVWRLSPPPAKPGGK